MTAAEKYVLALDQGTTSSRAIIFDSQGSIRSQAQEEFEQIYPGSGMVEHNPETIWQSQLRTAKNALSAAGLSAKNLAGIGIANQRETTILWDRNTGLPVYNAIVWQDRRTSSYCSNLKKSGVSSRVSDISGLPIDPYFSASKMRWILAHVPGLSDRAKRGEIAFGTVDSYLLWKLTNGRAHATDATNASRTLLYDLDQGDWSDELLDLFDVPREVLPEILPSCGAFGLTDRSLFGAEVPITGIAGDQHAATFGQACHSAGTVKNTYGTGSFLLMNTGPTPHRSTNGLISTIAWDLGAKALGSPRRSFALEGSVFVSGAAVQWLRDELKIISSSAEIEALAASVPDSGGVTFVPAFVGLGAPHWDADARGALLGLTRSTTRAHIARATLQAACFQTADVLAAMSADCGLKIPELRVDGGMTVNNMLLQMQANILGVPVVRPKVTETTALGAAYFAGLATSVWSDISSIAQCWKVDRIFDPQISEDERRSMRDGWSRSVNRVRSDQT